MEVSFFDKTAGEIVLKALEKSINRSLIAEFDRSKCSYV